MNDIYVCDVKVKVNSSGMYCLNDLHSASGGKKKDQPSNWLSSEKTKDLIKSVLNTGKQGIKKTAGRYGGTYVNENLVADYAMWINADFKLKVIEAFLDSEKGRKTSAELVDSVRIQKGRISQLIDNTTSNLSELKAHGSNWGSYGASIRQAKRQIVAELQDLQDEVQMKLDLL